MNPGSDNGYEEFVAEIKENLKAVNLAEAIRLAIKTCVSKNILVYFLREHGSEVENMLITEWNTEEALAVRYEEGVDTGIGIGVTRTAKNMLGDGVEPALVARYTKLPLEAVNALR